jgi:hypothetical protein
MQIVGKITWVGPVASGVSKAGKNWNKFNAVITEQEGEYPQSLCFEVFNDKISVALDEVCTIHFQVKANEYQGKYYTNISGWRKEGGGVVAAAAPVERAAHQAAPAAAVDDSDIPF